MFFWMLHLNKDQTLQPFFLFLGFKVISRAFTSEGVAEFHVPDFSTAWLSCDDFAVASSSQKRESARSAWPRCAVCSRAGGFSVGRCARKLGDMGERNYLHAHSNRACTCQHWAVFRTVNLEKGAVDS